MKMNSILLVDDEPSNIEVLVNIFDNDYEVFFATNGEKALELATIEQPNIILLDVMMPAIDGYEVCRRLKAHTATHHIAIIFITGLDDMAAELKALELGAADYVTKPFNPTIVKARVKNQINRQSIRR